MNEIHRAARFRVTKKAHDSEFRAVFTHQPAPFRAKRQSTRAEEVHRHQVARAARHPFDDSADSRRRRGAARGARGRATEASSSDPGRDAARVLDRRAHPSISRRDGAHGDPQCVAVHSSTGARPTSNGSRNRLFAMLTDTSKRNRFRVRFQTKPKNVRHEKTRAFASAS